MRKINENIYTWDAMENSTRPRISLICGSERSLLFDAGNSTNHATSIINEIANNNIIKPSYVLISHFHPDHWFGLSSYDSISISSNLTKSKIDRMREQKWDSKTVKEKVRLGKLDPMTEKMLNDEYGENRDSIDLKNIDIGIEKSITIELGQYECLFDYFGGNHALDSSVLFLIKDSILLCGDVLYLRNASSRNKEELLKKLTSYNANYYIDSHKNIIYNNDELKNEIDKM
jgi:glyoxylase-like metal-dependent hydrolase (beta-lactamase superfamily II)